MKINQVPQLQLYRFSWELNLSILTQNIKGLARQIATPAKWPKSPKSDFRTFPSLPPLPSPPRGPKPGRPRGPAAPKGLPFSSGARRSGRSMGNGKPADRSGRSPAMCPGRGNISSLNVIYTMINLLYHLGISLNVGFTLSSLMSKYVRHAMVPLNHVPALSRFKQCAPLDVSVTWAQTTLKQRQLNDFQSTSLQHCSVSPQHSEIMYSLFGTCWFAVNLVWVYWWLDRFRW